MAVSNAYKKYKNIVANNDKVATNTIGRAITNNGVVNPSGLGSRILDLGGYNKIASPTVTNTMVGQPGTISTRDNASPLVHGQGGQRIANNQTNNGTIPTNNGTIAAQTPAAGQTVISGNGNGVGASIGSNIQSSVNISGNRNMSLGDYIAMSGADPNRAYNNSVRSAIADYERQKATYGANAEALAGMGLTNSGTSNYLEQSAYSAMQSAKAQAAAQRDADMTALAGQYINYQAQQEQQRQQNLMEAYNTAVSLGLSGDNMSKYLKAIIPNISQEEIDGLTGATDSVVGDAAVNNFDEISNRLLAMTETGGDLAAAADYLKTSGAYSPEEIDNVVNALAKYEEDSTAANQAAEEAEQAATQVQNYDLLNTYTSNKELARALSIEGDNPPVEDITAAVDNLVKSGNLTKEQGDEIKNNAIQREVETLAKSPDKDEAMQLFILGEEYGTDKIVDTIEDIGVNQNGYLTFTIDGKEYSVGLQATNPIKDKSLKSSLDDYAKNNNLFKKNGAHSDALVPINGKLYRGYSTNGATMWFEVTKDKDGMKARTATIPLAKETEFNEDTGLVTAISTDTALETIYKAAEKLIKRR